MGYPNVQVTGASVLHDRVISATFSDGVVKERDLRPLLQGPVFERIRTDDHAFAEIAVDPEFGVITWPNGADVDAELLRYDDLWNARVELARSA